MLTLTNPRARAAAVAGVLIAAAPTGALASTRGFKATVPFSGGRTADLRAGEPLRFLLKGETITQVCWSPAPIGGEACGNRFAAAARPGRQRLTLTLKGGAVRRETIHVGPFATEVPVGVRAAGRASARVVEFRSTCTAHGYAGYRGGRLRGRRDAVAVHAGDRIAVFYRAGKHAVMAMPYASGEANFFPSGCLVQVHR